MNCKNCNKEIHPRRLKALPDTRTCVKCSRVGRVAGFPLITGKTEYSQLQLVDQATYQTLAKQQERKGLVSNGMKGIK